MDAIIFVFQVSLFAKNIKTKMNTALIIPKAFGSLNIEEYLPTLTQKLLLFKEVSGVG